MNTIAFREVRGSGGQDDQSNRSVARPGSWTTSWGSSRTASWRERRVATCGSYVQGQLSDLPRKSVEPMAGLAGVPPRTLQEFLSLSGLGPGQGAGPGAGGGGPGPYGRDAHRDRGRERAPEEGGEDRVRAAAVLRQHRQDRQLRHDRPPGLRLLGRHVPHHAGLGPVPAGVLGRPGKKGKEAERVRERRRAAAVPDDVRYRPKYEIALEQLRRARDNGLSFAWVTADEWYGGKPPFVAGLEAMGQRFVLEVPRNLTGWSHAPASAAGRGAGGGPVPPLPRRSPGSRGSGTT